MVATKYLTLPLTLSFILVITVSGCSGGNGDASGVGGAVSVGGSGQTAGGKSGVPQNTGADTGGRTAAPGTDAIGGRGTSNASGTRATGGTTLASSDRSTGGNSASAGSRSEGTTAATGGASATGSATSLGGASSTRAVASGGVNATSSATSLGGTSPNTTLTGGTSANGGLASTSAVSLISGGYPTTTGGSSSAGIIGGTGAMLATGGAFAGGGQATTGGSLSVGGTSNGGSSPVVELTGNWRFSITDSDSEPAPFTSYVALASAGSAIEGHAVDKDGLATISGTFDTALRKINFIKNYIAGTSKGQQFNYQGTFADPSGPLTGNWSGENASDVWSATFVSGYSPSAGAGDWTMLANWGTGTFTLAISPEGYVTGNMSDTNGASSLEGVLDLGNGSLFFRKLYTSGNTFWYFGSINSAGTQIANGKWGNTSAALTAGTWTAGR